MVTNQEERKERAMSCMELCTYDCAVLFREKIEELEKQLETQSKAIEKLIWAAKECEKKLSLEEQNIHVRHIASTLEKVLTEPEWFLE